MGTSINRHVERQCSTGIVTESEDDDPGIRGFSSCLSHNHHRINSKSKSKSDQTDPLDAAIIDQADTLVDSPALTLDQFVLGKTSVATEVAQGSISRPGSAVTSLKGVATSAPLLINEHRPMAGSPSSLTWASSSTDAGSPTSSMSSEEVPVAHATPQPRPDEVLGLPLKRMIKQICFTGLESSISHKKEFCLSVNEVRAVCKAAQEQFLSEPPLLRLDAPIKIVGDIHGQFRDLMRIFKMGGMPPRQQYLFTGDYVDRGKQSLETIMLLLLLKLRYPSHVHMLRGNHECASVSKVYGFYDECKRRSSVKVWRAVVDVFNTLPIAAIVGGSIFCVHGGLSPKLTSFSQIEAVQRPTDVPEAGLITDLLWSDPDPQVKEWSDNDRGVSYCFGARSLEQFCRRFGIDLVVRGHMVVEDGYEFFANRHLVTVFSAPNYCGDFDNYGAVMNIGAGLVCSFDVVEPRKTLRKGSSGGMRERHAAAARSPQKPQSALLA